MLTSVLRGSDSKGKLSRSLPDTSTFVPNDRSQCLHCVLPIMRCTFDAHLDVGLAERRTPCRFVGKHPISFTMTWTTANKFRQRAEEPGNGGTMMSLPKLEHDSIEVCHASYPTASGRVRGWQHYDEPSHNYKMAARAPS